MFGIEGMFGIFGIDYCDDIIDALDRCVMNLFDGSIEREFLEASCVES
jgi:hypothetical protein